MSGSHYVIGIGERTFDVRTNSGGEPGIMLDGAAVHAELLPGPDASVRRLKIDGRLLELLAHRSSDGSWSIALDGVMLNVSVQDERAIRLARFGGGAVARTGAEKVLAPMPGLVVRVNVEPGQTVKQGESLVVLQAMKMENELGSPRDATVKSVSATPGQTVDQGQVLVELE